MNGFDIIYLGLSGGKDSTALLLWATHTPWIMSKPLVVAFCDTGNEDALTYAFLKMLSARVYPVETISPQRDFWELARWKRRFPSRKARFCTQYLKVVPTNERLSALREHGRVLALDGIRREEAHTGNARGEATDDIRYDESLNIWRLSPLADWSIANVWAIHRQYLRLEWVRELVEKDLNLSDEHKALLIARTQVHGIPRNPLYDMGARRVGCFPCINSAKEEIRALAKFRPERVDFLARMEWWVGQVNTARYSSFFARKMVPEWFRSREVLTTNGRRVRIATIHDVVQWSHTAWGGKQFAMDLKN